MTVHPRAALTRRTSTARATSRPTGRSAARVSMFLRPLAADEHRAQFWVRHVQVGVVITELSVVVVMLYAILGRRPAVVPLCVVGVLVMAGSPALLLLPMERWSRDHRGPLVFYGWSLATTSLISSITVLDGGSSSPLDWLYVLTLAFACLAYPPLGVAVMGGITVLADASVSLVAPGPPAHAMVPGAVLCMVTAMTAWSSRNQWDLAEQQRMLADRLSTLADTDELTGCLNRRAFDVRLQEHLSGPGDEPVSLCVLDLDGFKRVNDTRGHGAGDQVLVDVARALRSVARQTDTVSRLGGDEFAVLLPGTSAEAAADVAYRLLGSLLGAVGDRQVSASVGVVTNHSARAASEVLAAADRLMYDAKAAGGRRFHAGVAS